MGLRADKTGGNPRSFDAHPRKQVLDFHTSADARAVEHD
jgi:hypothetical protein